MIRVAWWLGIFSIAACAGKLDNKNAFLEAGIPNDGGGTDTIEETCALSNIQTELVDAKCATAGCHSASAHGTAAGGGLALVNETVDGASLAQRLVDVDSDDCAGKKFIDSANIGQSYILEKLGESPTCGTAMPQIPPLFTEEEIACMQEWAQALAGAP
jgi:hypothetical protein